MPSPEPGLGGSPGRKTGGLQVLLSAGFLLVAGFLSSACAPAPDPTAVETPPLEFEYDGCVAVLLPVDAPTCVIGPLSELKIWARSAPGVALTVKIGDLQLESSEATEIDDGGFLFQPPPIEADRLIVIADNGSVRREEVLKLRPEPSWPPAGEIPPKGEARAYHLRASIRASTGGAEALQPNEVLACYQEAEELFEQAGNRSAAIAVATARHYHLFYHLNRPAEAGRVLDELPEAPRGDGLSAFNIAFFRGSWANRNGRFRAALRFVDEAASHDRRLDLGRRHFPEQTRALVLSRLGRYDEAMESISWLEGDVDNRASAAARAEIWTNIGWSRLLTAEAGRDVDSAVPALLRALVEAEAAGETGDIDNIELNLSLAYLHQGRLAKAREHFHRLQRRTGGGPTPWWLETWILDVGGRLNMAEGEPSASLKHYERLAEHPAALNPDTAWRAARGRAKALEALGRMNEAVAAYDAAEALIDRAGAAAPLDEGRLGSMVIFRQGTTAYLDLLLRLDGMDEALKIARRARARLVRGLATDRRLEGLDPGRAAEWDRLVERYRVLQAGLRERFDELENAAADRVPALRAAQKRGRRELGMTFDALLELVGDAATGDESRPLAEPAAGELWLVFHPLPDGLLAMAFRPDEDGTSGEDGVHAERLPSQGLDGMTPDALAEHLLKPFDDWIDEAESLRVLPHGELWDVSFEALPWRGAPLVAALPVTYALDLPALPPAADPQRRALLIADPTGRLPHADDEVAEVARRLDERATWQVWAPAGSSLSVAQTLRDLTQADGLFHFAGHGNLLGSTARSGLVFEQGFEGNQLLSIHDVLTLPSVPATVVLSGCDTLRPGSGSGSAELGVGHAFLLAGAHHVVGAVTKVDDAVARRLMEHFYAHWQGPGHEAEALRQAQLELHAQGIDGWSSFRVLSR